MLITCPTFLILDVGNNTGMANKGALFIILFCLFSIQYTNSQQKDFFEGIITYKIESNDNGYGDTLTVYIKEGYIKNLYNTKQKGGIREEILHPDTGIIYMKLVGIDTLYSYNLKKDNSLELIKIINTESQEEILDHKCNLLEVKTKYTRGNNDFFIINKCYYTSNHLKLNVKWFENYKFGYSSIIYSRIKSYHLKYEMISPSFNLTFTAIDILHKKINSNLFNKDIDVPLKKYKIQ